jgi:hypothetical protein
MGRSLAAITAMLILDSPTMTELQTQLERTDVRISRVEKKRINRISWNRACKNAIHLKKFKYCPKAQRNDH